MVELNVYNFIFIAIGIFIILVSIANSELFFGTRKAKFFVNTFGRQGARIFYLFVGIGLIIMALITPIGVVPTQH